MCSGAVVTITAGGGDEGGSAGEAGEEEIECVRGEGAAAVLLDDVRGVSVRGIGRGSVGGAGGGGSECTSGSDSEGAR